MAQLAQFAQVEKLEAIAASQTELDAAGSAPSPARACSAAR